MSMHRSLKTKSGALEAHRSVLTRPERIAKLRQDGVFDDDAEPIHLVKVRNIKIVTAKKKKEVAEGEEGDAEGASDVPATPATPAE